MLGIGTIIFICISQKDGTKQKLCNNIWHYHLEILIIPEFPKYFLNIYSLANSYILYSCKEEEVYRNKLEPYFIPNQGEMFYAGIASKFNIYL